MSKQKSLGLNAVLNGVRTILNMIFPLITFPYVSRVLGVENIGKFNFASSVNNYFMLIAALGVSTYSIREGAKFRERRTKFSEFASEVFSINIVSTLIAYLLLLVCIILVPKLHNYTVIILVFSIEIIFTTLGTEWVYSIFEDYAYITIRSIAFKIISIILLLFFVKEPNDFIIYAGITVFANAASNILNFIRLRRYCDIRFTLHCEWRKHLKPILIIFASSVATSIYVNSDITMLGFMATDYEVGIYSVSTKIYRIVKQMLSAVLIVSIPRLAMLMGQKRLEEYKDTLTQIFNVLTILVLPTMVGLFILSREVVLLISSSAYIQATSSLRLLSIALIFCIYGWIFNQCVLIPARKEKIVLIATVSSAIVNIVINLIFIPVWKENTAAFSTIVAEAIMMVVCTYNGLKVVKLSPIIRNNMLTTGLGCVIIAIICISIQRLNLPLIWTLVLCIISSVLGYGLSLIVFGNQVAKEFLNKVLLKIKNSTVSRI